MRSLKKILLLALMIVSSFLLAKEQLPHLMLHFDINKTLIASDKAKNKSVDDVLKELLAEKHSSLDLYKLQSENNKIFHSFYKLIDYLNHNKIPYTIILRSFGDEVAEVRDEINATYHDMITHFGEFEQTTLHYDEEQSTSDPRTAYEYLRHFGNVAIHDDWGYWSENNKRSENGKPFYLDLEDKGTLSLFFDDNIDIDNVEQNIIAPIDVRTGRVLSLKSLVQSGQAIPVDTLEAMTNEDYFINKILKAIALRSLSIY